MGRPYLVSVSISACRQLPHGVIGSASNSPFSFRAAMAIVVTASSGYCAPAEKSAERSAHIVTG